jgi:23S rRNA (cytidine1920-2'-O)/16S rRNA (cytidine1409-2'-O)-methyltransferase
MKKEKLINLIMEQFGYDEKKAAGLILSGNVLVNDVPALKAGFKFEISSDIRFKNIKKYVSRGAYKLNTAFTNFDIDATDKICLDAGSSTGGFTEILLEKGAKKVFAIDCGENQLDYSLRINPKVEVHENTKIQDLKKNDFMEKPVFAVMDVSFTSSIFLIEFLHNNLDIKEMVVLIKPQFEYERLALILELPLNFNGVLNDESLRLKIINKVNLEIENLGLKVIKKVESDIMGMRGNLEYLFHIKE